MSDAPTEPGDGELMLDVVTMMTANARRVASTAVESARDSEEDDLVAAVAAALSRETDAIVQGCPPGNAALIGAVRAAGTAIESVATQALRTGTQGPEESLQRAFDLFASYVQGPGRPRIVATDRGESDPDQ